MKKLLFLSLLLAVPLVQAVESGETSETKSSGNWASQIVDKMLSPIPQAFRFPVRVAVGMGAGYTIYEAVNYLVPDKVDAVIDKILVAVPGEALQTIIRDNKAHFCALGIAAYTWGMTLEQFGNVISAAGAASLTAVTRNRMRGRRAYRTSNNEYARIVYEIIVTAGPQFIKYAPQLIAFFSK